MEIETGKALHPSLRWCHQYEFEISDLWRQSLQRETSRELILFSNSTAAERRNREKFLARFFSDWRCPACLSAPSPPSTENGANPPLLVGAAVTETSSIHLHVSTAKQTQAQETSVVLSTIGSDSCLNYAAGELERRQDFIAAEPSRQNPPFRPSGALAYRQHDPILPVPTTSQDPSPSHVSLSPPPHSSKSIELSRPTDAITATDSSSTLRQCELLAELISANGFHVDKFMSPDLQRQLKVQHDLTSSCVPPEHAGVSEMAPLSRPFVGDPSAETPLMSRSLNESMNAEDVGNPERYLSRISGEGDAQAYLNPEIFSKAISLINSRRSSAGDEPYAEAPATSGPQLTPEAFHDVFLPEGSKSVEPSKLSGDEAVKAKMKQEGADPDMLDKAPSEKISESVKLEPKSVEKKKQIAKVRKKKLHWQPLDRSRLSTNSLWFDDDNEDDVALDEDEFRQLFEERIDVVTKVAPKVKETEKKEYLPTKEEIQTLQSYSGDQKVLGQAERYMMAMMTLKGAFRRIECMLYKKQFPTRVAEIRGQIEIVEKCSKDVRASVGLKKTLRTILKVGNQMNDGGNVGFTLDSLLKLESAKAFDKKTSILQYVITLVDRSDPGSLSFPEELSRVTDASRVSLDTINGDLADLEKGLEVSKSIAEEMQGDRGLSTEGVDVIGSFLLEATNECAKLKEEVTVMKKSFSDTLMYFGEDESMSSVDFFSTLDKFLR
eukprot:gene1599-1859_t